MRKFLPLAACLFVLLFASSSLGAECQDGSTCVPPDDMAVFVKLLQEKDCLQSKPPELDLDKISVVQDKDGRVFLSGSDPIPYTVRFKWCGYEVEAKSKLNVVVARAEPETWGLRFRLKAAPGYLPVTALVEKDGYAGLDFGLLAEPFFLQWANLNAYVGVRSVGAGLGFDLTDTVGLYAGYAVTWGTWQHNPHMAISFDLW